MKKGTIFVVEDEVIIADDIKSYLQKFGYKVPLIATSGEEALKRVRDVRPDLVLMDIVLRGEMDGIETAERIRSEFDIPIVYLTAFADDETLERAKITEPFGYIIKPFEERDLYTTIEMALYKHKMERKLKESEAKFRRIVETAQEGIWVLDTEDRTTYVNKRMAEMLGYREDEMIGRKLVDFLIEKEHSRVPRGFEPLMSGSREVLDFKFHRRDGSFLWGMLSTTPIQDSDGRVIGFLGMITDVTERKRATAAIQESHERLLTILESLDAIVYVADMETHEVLFANNYAQKVFGDVAGKVCWDTFRKGQDGPSKSCTNDKLLTADGKPAGVCTWEFQNTVTGKWFDIRARAIPWVDGRMVRLEIATDITARRRMEEELIKSQKLESIGILAGGIAHDFNNVLTGIMGNISLVLLDRDLSEKTQKRLSEAEKSCIRAKDLTQRLLTFARGGAPVKKISSVSSLLKDAASFALTGTTAKSEFSLPGEYCYAEIDEGQMRQVIHNIIINAVESMPQGGTVKVACQKIKLNAEDGIPLQAGDYAKISIQDAGTGISPEHLPKIFDPYFTTKEKRAGMGLATAYSIIKNHGGYITAESKPGKGTTIFIYLPIVMMEPAPLKVEDVKFPFSSGRVLIMDDEEIIRNVVGEMLMHLGYEVGFAEDGAEAIRLYREAMAASRPFHAVIMDLTIPGGMGGKEAIAKLREIDSHVKAIVSSGYSNDPVMANFKEYGFVGVVTKPYKMKDMNETLRRVLAQSNS
ncbi:MAG TPA: response regulator [Nitrospirota bacterium]|nr:response regulator [Nitrospirota bacterium]